MRSWPFDREEGVGAGILEEKAIASSSFRVGERVVYCHPFMSDSVVEEAMFRMCVLGLREDENVVL